MSQLLLILGHFDKLSDRYFTVAQSALTYHSNCGHFDKLSDRYFTVARISETYHSGSGP